MLTDKCLSNNPRICVVGLGYVGLPLAIEFSKKYETVGFDINPIRVKELKTGKDSTLEVEIDSLKRAKKNLNFTNIIIKIEPLKKLELFEAINIILIRNS